MTRDRSAPSAQGLRARLLTGAALIVCVPLIIASPALAQTSPTAPLPPAPVVTTQTPGSDGLTPDAVYLDAGAVTRTGDVISARGTPEARVLARFRNNTLRAGAFTYDLRQRLAIADDRVELVGAEGDVIYASHLELGSDLKAGVAVDFATRLSDGSSLMAATAARRSEKVNELNYVIFTPCPICDDAGNDKTPSISVQAEKAVQDTELRAILFRNAVFRVGGVPVFYLPAFALPDPTVERASGLLVPNANFDEGRGVSVEVPYLHVVSPSEDWLISPQINSSVAPLLNLQWRRRFATGTIEARGGYTFAKNFGDFDLDGDGDAETNVDFGDETSRSYFLANGRFDPDGSWRWGFTAERTSDKTLFDRYDINDPYQDNGLYYGDQRRLISQLYAERQTERSYFSIAAFTFQSLRVTQFDDITAALNVFEDDSTLPVVAPLIDYRFEPRGKVLGGRLRFHGSAASLYRDTFVGAPILRPEVVPTGSTTGLDGVDSRRITGQGEWRRTLISAAGIRYEPFVDARFDLYSVSDLPDFLGQDDVMISRGRATVGLDVSYPVIRRLSPTSDLIDVGLSLRITG